MNEGAIYSIIDCIDEWPINTNTVILEKKLENISFKVTAITDGSILVQIGENKFQSQKIVFKNAIRAIFGVNWNFGLSSEIKVTLNNINVKEKNIKEEFLTITSSPRLNNTIPSLFNPAARENCTKWINWRTERYGNIKMHPKKDRKLKTLEQQIEDLSNAIISLHNHIENLKNEKLFLLNALPLLRALLFWSAKGNTYNPLLFRIAGLKKSPLPVYAVANSENEKFKRPPFDDDIIFNVFNFPSLKQSSPAQEIMDFQEWLSTPFVFERVAYSDKVFTMKDILFESANTVSAAHFDDDTPFIVEILENTKSFERSTLYEYTLLISKITVTLGKFLILQK